MNDLTRVATLNATAIEQRKAQRRDLPVLAVVAFLAVWLLLDALSVLVERLS